MNVAQELKANGDLVGVALKDLAQVAAAIDTPHNRDVLKEMSCSTPDTPDEEIADTEPDELAYYLGCDEDHANAVKQCHRSLAFAEAISGSGGQPAGCHPEIYADRHVNKYFVDYDSFSSNHRQTITRGELDDVVKAAVWDVAIEELLDRWNTKRKIDVALWLMAESFRRVGCLHVETMVKSEADIVIRSRVIPGSTIGIGWFPTSSCSGQVEFHIDSSWAASLHPLSHLFCHEGGHCNNLRHTFTGQGSHHGIMSYSPKYPLEGFSPGKAPWTKPRDPSMSVLIRQYGDEWVPLPGVDNPPPPALPAFDGLLRGEEFERGKFAIRGGLVAARDVARGESFIVEPTSDAGLYRVIIRPRI